MNTLERLLKRIGALRARWNARSRAIARAVIKTADAETVADSPEIVVGSPNCSTASLVRNSVPPEHRQSLVRRLTKGTFLIGLCFIGMWLAVSREWPQGPRFPDATVCLSMASRGEYAWIRLQDPQDTQVRDPGTLDVFAKPNMVKFVDKDKGTAVQIAWSFFRRRNANYDTYEFSIIGPSGAQTSKGVDISTEPVVLLKEGNLVMTIRHRPRQANLESPDAK